MAESSVTNVPVPQATPSARELDDLDLIVSGALGPDVTGFVNPAQVDPTSPTATLTLRVTSQVADNALAAGAIDLVDPEGAPLARLTVESTYADGDQRTGMAGTVEATEQNHFGPFRRLHVSPARVHAELAPGDLLAVPTHRPLTEPDLDRIAAEATGTARRPLLLACVGTGMPDGVSGPALVRATLAAAQNLAGRGVDAEVVAVSLADHGWGTDDEPGPNDRLLDAVAAAYADAALRIDRTGAGRLPADIAAIVTHDRPPRNEQGVVFFFTGLSGSGKSTLARALVDHILERGERTITSLDGDVVRHHLSKGLSFSREDRNTNIERIGFVAAEIAHNHGIAVCSPIAPFEETRAKVRKMVEGRGGGFVLIHVATPLEECERRDRKGLYAKARAGKIPDFTGISSPYEEPTDAYKIDTTNRDIAECLDELVAYFTDEGWLTP